MKRKSVIILALASLFVLGACGRSQSATNTSSTSKAKTSQTSSSTKSKTKASSSSSSVSSSETSEGAVASSSLATSSADSKASSSSAVQEKTPAQAATKDVSNIASFVGTWANDRGESVTINADGSVVTTSSDGRTYNMALSFTQELNGVGFYGVYVPGALVGGAGLLYIPAGVTNPHIGTTDAQDTLVIGQDVSADEHPYYRQ